MFFEQNKRNNNNTECPGKTGQKKIAQKNNLIYVVTYIFTIDFY